MRSAYIKLTTFITIVMLLLLLAACSRTGERASSSKPSASPSPTTITTTSGEGTTATYQVSEQYFTADRSGFHEGESTALRWNVPGAHSVNIENEGGTIYTSSSESGSVQVTPHADVHGQAKYTLIARKGSSGETSKLELTITVSK